MRYCIENLTLSGIKVLSLLVLISSSAVAEVNSDSSLPYHARMLLAEQGNPWALPESSWQPQPFHFPQYYQKNKHNAETPDSGPSRQPEYHDSWQSQQRFVTPEILDSIKKQQSQMQKLPPQYGDYRYSAPRRAVPFMTMPPPAYPSNPAGSYYGMPLPSEMEFANPMYDIPSVSPWGDGPDVMLRGQSLPWVPDEAIGGLPPMSISPYFDEGRYGNAGSNPSSGDEKYQQQEKNDSLGGDLTSPQENIFNPFTFIPNKALQ